MIPKKEFNPHFIVLSYTFSFAAERPRGSITKRPNGMLQLLLQDSGQNI